MRSFKLLSVLLCAVLILLLAACTGGKANAEVVLGDVLSDINGKASISADAMRAVEDKDSLELYYSIAPEDVKQFAGETAKNSSEDVTEIVLIEAVSADAAGRVYDALSLRYESQRNLCASYSAELLSIIDGCKVEQNGNFVTLVLSADYDLIMQVVNSYI